MTQHRYRCLVVDDEALGRELIETHLKQLPSFELVASCASAVEASELLSTQPVDLLFLDIEMPVLKGTDFYQGLAHRPRVIFTTAYRDYALEGFELEAVDYLLKPITFARFFRATQRFLASAQAGRLTPEDSGESNNASIFIRVNRKDVRLALADVVYVQGLKDYVRVHTRNSVFTVKETMTSLSQRMGEGFLRVHRSYLVNQSAITALTRHDVELGELEIPIGDTYRDSVVEKMGHTR